MRIDGFCDGGNPSRAVDVRDAAGECEWARRERRSAGCSGWRPRAFKICSGVAGGGGRGGGGATAAPGIYTIKLSVGGRDYTKPVSVLEDRWAHENK